MSRRLRPEEIEEQEQPASQEVSRFLVLGFLIAGLLGLFTGLMWMAWNLFMRHVAG